MRELLLQGCRILVVEDEYFIAEAMQAGLESEGAVVLGPVPSVRTALGLLDTETMLDGALLDINLGSEKVFPVADALQARGIPFLFATGYDAMDVPPIWQHVTRLEKPVEARTITQALLSADLSASATPPN